MARPLTIRIDTDTYRRPTQEEVDEAKRYILRRNEVAEHAWFIAYDLIMKAVMKLIRISYKYNIPPEKFSFDRMTSPQMMDEVDRVMDRLEEDLYDLLEDEALSCTKDSSNRMYLLASLAAMGHRNMSLSETMQAYEWRVLRQTEALVAAAKFDKKDEKQTERLAKLYMARMDQNPVIQKTSKYRMLFIAPFLRSGGKVTYPNGAPNVQGVPTDGVNALKQVYFNAISATWMKNQRLEMVQDGCAGYYQMRGSDIPCAVCDDEVGFHEGINPMEEPFPHPRCCCYRIPVYYNGEQGEQLTLL